MKKQMGFILACTGSVIMFFGCGKQEEGDGYLTNAADQQFALMAALSNSAEIDAALLTEENSDSADIEEYGAMIVTDHAIAQSRLKSIAESLHLYAPDSVNAEYIALRQLLIDTTKRGFDSLYIHNQIKDHQAAIALFENEVSQGRHIRLRDYARENLPALRRHLEHAEMLAEDY